MTFLKVCFLIFVKDLKDEIRKKENILASLFFGLLSVVLFHFAVDSTEIDLSKDGSGLLWLIIIFAGTIFMQNLFKKEEENGTFYALILAPVDRAAVYLGKFAVSFLFLLILEFFLFALSFFFFNFPVLKSFFWLLLILCSINAGFSALGTLISSLTVNQKGSFILYPLLLYPLLFPLFIAAVSLTQRFIKAQLSFSEPWLRLVILFDIIFLTVSSLLFELITEE